MFLDGGLARKREDISHFEPIAFFNHPSVDEVQKELFGVTTRPREITDRIHEMKEKLKTSIYDFIKRFDLELLIPQNILAIRCIYPLVSP